MSALHLKSTWSRTRSLKCQKAYQNIIPQSYVYIVHIPTFLPWVSVVTTLHQKSRIKSYLTYLKLDVRVRIFVTFSFQRRYETVSATFWLTHCSVVDLPIESNSGYTGWTVDPLIFSPHSGWQVVCPPKKSISKLCTTPTVQYKSRAWRVSNKAQSWRTWEL